MPEETQSYSAPRAVHPQSNRAAVRTGFFGALGVCLLGLIALVGWHLTQATLEIAAPFIVATAFALLLDPLADRLEKRGMSRVAAVATVFVAFLLLLIGIGALAIPALINQTSQLAENGPKYIGGLRTSVNEFLAAHPRIMGIKMPSNANVLSTELSTRASQIVSQSSGKITAFLLGSITTLLQTVIMLIVTFYLLLDIDRLRARLFYLLPEKARKPMRLYSRDIGNVFADYARGMLIVSALYGVATLGTLLLLSLVHHELAGYALLVAVAGGLLYIVPYIGPLVTALITFLVAFAAGGAGFGVWGIVATLVLNQVFDNIVTPRVVGGGVGLHPVASLFALTLGGALFGLWGLLLSVPIAASIQVVLFRLYPKLTTPTPPAFLRAQGVQPGEEDSARVLVGDEAQMPEHAT